MTNNNDFEFLIIIIIIIIINCHYFINIYTIKQEKQLFFDLTGRKIYFIYTHSGEESF